MTRIKICGLTESRHVKTAAMLQVDFVGFVFAESKRRITPERAAELIAGAKEHDLHPAAVGVFVNEPADYINRIARQCNLDWIQLSGDEPWDFCAAVDLPVIRVLHITPDKTADDIAGSIEHVYKLYDRNRLIILLDSKIEGCYGGTGSTFDWNLLQTISAGYPVMVAGGLNPGNIGTLVKQFHPWGVDVSSGVEINGNKDSNLIREFINSVRLSSGQKGELQCCQITEDILENSAGGSHRKR
jgi:phosphoribosylanthranilate isomerase